MAGLINFEDEKEVKEFLDNLGTEYSYQCHKEKDPEGCLRLADYLDGVKKNYEAAAQVLRHNCEQNGHGESCYKLGTYHIAGKGPMGNLARMPRLDPYSFLETPIFSMTTESQDLGFTSHPRTVPIYSIVPCGVPACLRSAYSCFLRSCEKGGKKRAEACHSVGLLAHDGRALEAGPDAGAARSYYERACGEGLAASCFNLSVLYITGAPGLASDMGRALQFALQACQLGHVWGCANASRMFKLGEGVPKDQARAEELKNRAKELHSQQKEAQLTFGE
ncbi:COA7 factor, partial [Atractosteus spatula]|nr:COA7 factor [Atractosteus spatula]